MKKLVLLFATALACFSCKTYSISPESFKEQFAGIDSTALTTTYINAPNVVAATTHGPNYYTMKYLGNNLKWIKVYDKKGSLVQLANAPSLEMRVTLKNGKRKYMYFDTTIIDKDTLYGSKSRFLNGLNQRIPFEEIKEIEIQEGGKKFSYQ